MKKALFLAVSTALVSNIVSMKTFPSGLPNGVRPREDVSNLSSTVSEVHDEDEHHGELSDAAPDVTENASPNSHRAHGGVRRGGHSMAEVLNFFDTEPEESSGEVECCDEFSPVTPGAGGSTRSCSRCVGAVGSGGSGPGDADPYLYYVRNVERCWHMCKRDELSQEISDMSRYLDGFRFASGTEEIGELRSSFESLRRRLCILLCYGMTESEFDELVSLFCDIYRHNELNNVKVDPILKPLYEGFLYTRGGWNFVDSLLNQVLLNNPSISVRCCCPAAYDWLKSIPSYRFLEDSPRRGNSVCGKFEAFVKCRLTDVIYSFFHSRGAFFRGEGNLRRNEVGPMLMRLNPQRAWEEFLGFYARVRRDFNLFRQRMEDSAALLSSSDEENPVRMGGIGDKSPRGSFRGVGGVKRSLSPAHRSPSGHSSKKKKMSTGALTENRMSPKRSLSESRGAGASYSPFGGSKKGGTSLYQASPLEKMDKKKKISGGNSLKSGKNEVVESPLKLTFSGGVKGVRTSSVQGVSPGQQSKKSPKRLSVGRDSSPMGILNERKRDGVPSKPIFSGSFEKERGTPVQESPLGRENKKRMSSVNDSVWSSSSPKGNLTKRRSGKSLTRDGSLDRVSPIKQQDKKGVSSVRGSVRGPSSPRRDLNEIRGGMSPLEDGFFIDLRKKKHLSPESSPRSSATLIGSAVPQGVVKTSTPSTVEKSSAAKPKLSKKERKKIKRQRVGKEIRRGVPNEGVRELRGELERHSAEKAELEKAVRNSESERVELVKKQQDLEKKLRDESEAKDVAQKQQSVLEEVIRNNESERADLVKRREDLERKLEEESEARKLAQRRESELKEVVRNNENERVGLVKKQQDLEKKLRDESEAKDVAQKKRLELEKDLRDQREKLGIHFKEEKRLREQVGEQKSRLEKLEREQKHLEDQVAKKTKLLQKRNDELKGYAERESELERAIEKHQKEAEMRSREETQFRESAQKREVELKAALQKQLKEFEDQRAEKWRLEELLEKHQYEIRKYSEEEVKLKDALQKCSKELDGRAEEKSKLEESLKKMQEELRRYSEKESELKASLIERMTELEELSKKKSEVQSLLDEHRKNAEMSSKKEVKFREAAQRREAELMKTIQEQRKAIDEHAAEKAGFEKSLREQRKAIDEHAAEKAGFEKSLREQEDKLKKSLQHQDELKVQVAEKTKLLQVRETKIEEYSSREASLRESLQKQKEELREHVAKRSELERSLQGQKEELKKSTEEDVKLRETLKKYQEELEKHVAEKSELVESVRKQKEDLEKCSEREVKLRKLLEEQGKKLKEQESEKAKLRESLRNREGELERKAKKEVELQSLLKDRQREVDVYSENEAIVRKREAELNELLKEQQEKFKEQEADRSRLEKLLKERDEELNQRAKKEAELTESFQSQRKELDERVAKELELKNALQEQQEELIRRSGDDAKMLEQQKEFESVLEEKERLEKLIQKQNEKLDEHLKEEERLKELARIQKEDADRILKEREDELESLRLFQRETKDMHSRAMEQFSEILSGYATGLGDLVGSLKDSKSRSARRLLGDACVEVFGAVGGSGDFMDRFRDRFIATGSDGVVDSLLGFADSLSRVNNMLADAFIRGVPSSPSLRRSRSVSLLPMQKTVRKFEGSNVEYEGNVSSLGFVNGRIMFVDGLRYFLDVDFRSFNWSDVSLCWEGMDASSGANPIFQGANFSFSISPSDFFAGFSCHNVYYVAGKGIVFILGTGREMKGNATCLIFAKDFMFMGEVKRDCGNRRLFEISMGGKRFYSDVYPAMVMASGTISNSSRSVSCVGKIKLQEFIEGVLSGGFDNLIAAGGDQNRGLSMRQVGASQLSPVMSFSDDEDSLETTGMDSHVSGTPRLTRRQFVGVREVTPPYLRGRGLPLSPSMMNDDDDFVNLLGNEGGADLAIGYNNDNNDNNNGNSNDNSDNNELGENNGN